MISFSFARFVNKSNNEAMSGESTKLMAYLNRVAEILNTHLVSAADANITLDVSITSNLGLIASAGANYAGQYEVVQGVVLPVSMVNAAFYKVQTGKSALYADGSTPAGSTNLYGGIADGTLNVSEYAMQQIVNYVSSSPVAPDENDFYVGTLVHEMMHILGFNGLLSVQTGKASTLFGGIDPKWGSPYDHYVKVGWDGAYFFNFTGPAATAIFGSNVPLTSLHGTNYPIYHIDVDGANDLMGDSASPGQKIGDLDVAMLVDLGYRNARTLVSKDGHTFIPGAGAVTVAGAAGAHIDTAFFAGKLAEYDVLASAGSIRVAERTNQGNVADLRDIEVLRFADGKLQTSGIGTAGDDVINGTAGADTFYGGRGNDTFISNGGVDRVAYSGVAANYEVSKSADGYVIKDRTGVDGTDTLIGVTRLWFADKSVALDIDGTAGKVYRLYQAAFNRKPDAEGLSFWIDAGDHGVTMESIAAQFIRGSEFAILYNDARFNNAKFLSKLYENILHRAPDQSGYDWWLDKLDHDLPQAKILADFSEGPENRAQVIGSIVNGIEYMHWA